MGISIITLVTLGVLGAFSTPALAVNDVRLYTATEPGGGYLPYACHHGQSYGPFPDTQYKWVNNCDVRVWLYQNLDGSGYNFCVSPDTSFFPQQTL